MQLTMAIEKEQQGSEEQQALQRRKIYNVYRTGLLTFTSLYTLFYAGAFFGYGPMILLLERDGAFAQNCPTTSTKNCPNQTSQLLNVHFVGTLMQILTPLVGHLCDTRGPLATMVYTATTALAGIVTLIVSRAIPVDELLYPAFCLLGMHTCATSVMCVVTGGVFKVYHDEGQQAKAEEMTSKEPEPQSHNGVSEVAQVANNNNQEQHDDQSPDDKGPRRVIGFLNNLFDAGSITYLILWEAHKSFGTSLQDLLYWYLGGAVFLFGGAITCWMLVLKHQEQDEKLQNEKAKDGIDQTLATIAGGNAPEAPLLENNDDCRDDETSESPRAAVTEHLHGQAASKEEWRQLFSASYWWLVAFFAFHVGRNQFVLTSAEAFLKNLGDTDDKYIAIFTMIMPASIFGFPFVDWALGRYGYHAALQLINLLGLVHGVIQISATNSLNVQIIGFLVFSFYRCFLFSVIFAYLAVLMPEKVLGKANGIMHISSGASALLNIPLGNAAVQQWNGSFFIPNCVYVLGILPFFYAAYRTSRGIRSSENGHTSHKSLAMEDEVAKA